MGLTTAPGVGGGGPAPHWLQAPAEPATGRSQQTQTGLQVYPGGVGCPGCPHQLLGGSELTQRDLCLCQAHVQEGDARRCWTASSLGGESLAREQAAYSTLFYKQPTLRSPLHPSTVVCLTPLSTG